MIAAYLPVVNYNPFTAESFNKRQLRALQPNQVDKILEITTKTSELPVLKLPTDDKELEAYKKKLPKKKLATTKSVLTKKLDKWVKLHNKKHWKDKSVPKIKANHKFSLKYLFSNFYRALLNGCLVENSFQYSPSATAYYNDCERHTPARHVDRFKELGLLTVWKSPLCFRGNSFIRFSDWIIDDLIGNVWLALETAQAEEIPSPPTTPPRNHMESPYTRPVPPPTTPKLPPVSRTVNPSPQPVAAAIEPDERARKIAELKESMGIDYNEEMMQAWASLSANNPTLYGKQRVEDLLNNFRCNKKPK